MGPPLSPSCEQMLDNKCSFKGQTASCGDRIAWLESNQGMSWDDAYEQVKSDCGKTCTCAMGPTLKPTTGPPTPYVSCGDRINWLESTQGETPAQAYAQVAEEFPNICV